MAECKCRTQGDYPQPPLGRSRRQARAGSNVICNDDLATVQPEPCDYTIKPYYSYYRKPSHMAPPTIQVPYCYNWSQDQVKDWLVDVGYGRYGPMFQKNGITGRDLVNLGAHDYRRMGFRDWNDCIALEELARCFTLRTYPSPREEVCGIPYPQDAALFYSPPNDHLINTARNIHRLPETSSYTRDGISRQIYNTAGDRYFYMQYNRPVPTI